MGKKNNKIELGDLFETSEGLAIEEAKINLIENLNRNICIEVPGIIIKETKFYSALEENNPDTNFYFYNYCLLIRAEIEHNNILLKVKRNKFYTYKYSIFANGIMIEKEIRNINKLIETLPIIVHNTNVFYSQIKKWVLLDDEITRLTKQRNKLSPSIRRLDTKLDINVIGELKETSRV